MKEFSPENSYVNAQAGEECSPAGLKLAGTMPRELSLHESNVLTWNLLNAAVKRVLAVHPFSSRVLFGDNLKSTDGGRTGIR